MIFQQSCSIHLDLDPLLCNLRRDHRVIQNGVVDDLQGTEPGTQFSFFQQGLPRKLGKDGPLGVKHHIHSSRTHFLAISALLLLGNGDEQLPQGHLLVVVHLQVDPFLNLIRFLIQHLEPVTWDVLENKTDSTYLAS